MPFDKLRANGRGNKAGTRRPFVKLRANGRPGKAGSGRLFDQFDRLRTSAHRTN